MARFTFEELEGGPVGLLGKTRACTMRFQDLRQILDALKKENPETVTYYESFA